MISVLVTILILCIIFAVAWWVIGLIPWPASPPAPPFARIAQVILALILLIYLVYMLLPYAAFGHPMLR
jgi:hypothetical protein